MITAPVLIDEVRRVGGFMVLVLHVDRPPEIELELPLNADWLIEEIRRHKPEVVNELKRRYLIGAGLSERVQ